MENNTLGVSIDDYAFSDDFTIGTMQKLQSALGTLEQWYSCENQNEYN
jgi:hypothetical protein